MKKHVKTVEVVTFEKGLVVRVKGKQLSTASLKSCDKVANEDILTLGKTDENVNGLELREHGQHSKQEVWVPHPLENSPGKPEKQKVKIKK